MIRYVPRHERVGHEKTGRRRGVQMRANIRENLNFYHAGWEDEGGRKEEKTRWQFFKRSRTAARRVTPNPPPTRILPFAFC